VLRNSFCFLPSADFRLERMLWQKGIIHWDDFFSLNGASSLSERKEKRLLLELEEAEVEYTAENSEYFHSLLPESEKWRLFKDFEKDAMYFDIESTGLGFNDKTTVLGTLFKGKFNTLVRNGDLTRENIAKELSKAKLLISFNGSQFDIPFIEKEFRVRVDIPHIDLRYVGYQLNLSGGLKVIEKQLGFERGETIEGLNGYNAVKLWWEHLQGKEEALPTLLEYNRLDVENLEKVMHYCYNELKKKRMNKA